jgi:UDP-2,3-diacylglucosamine pyrophosphatase LpxH
VKSGSDSFEEVMCTECFQERVVAVIHGHQHQPASQKLGNVHVLDVGTFKSGCFGQFELRRRPRTGKWAMASFKY